MAAPSERVGIDRVSSLPVREIDLGSSTARAWANAGSNSQQASLPDGAMSGVEGLAGFGVCVVLRRLATVVFPVVAYDPYSPDPCLVIRRGSLLVGLRCSGVLPGYEQNQVAGRKYGVEDVPRRTVGGPRVQAEPLGAIVRVVGLLPLRGTGRVDQRDRRSLPDFGLVEPLLREGVPSRHLIVGSDLADAQVVVCEDFVAALLLDFVMAP